MRLLPTPLRDPAQRPGLLGWLGVGMALRLLLMPFAVSADTLAVYWRSHLIAYEGEVFGAYMVNMGAHYVHAANLRLMDWMLPPPDEVWTDPWFFDEFIALAPQVLDAWAAAPHVNQTLFALKIPYLIAEVGAGLLLLALLRDREPVAIRRAWIFWMLSPIGLYATYVFTRYEAFAVVFVVAALLCVERGRPWVGALLLGVAITMRGYPLMLVPVFALVAGATVANRPGWPVAVRQALWAVVAVIPFALIMASNRLLAGTVGELARLQQLHTGNSLLNYTLPVHGPGQVYVFVLFALLVVGVMAGRTWGWWGPGPILVRELWVWLFLLHAGLFALGTFGAHYFMWMTPFIAIAIARREQWRAVLPLHLLQVVVVLSIADLLGGPDTIVGLFRPASPLASSLPNLRELLLTRPELTEQLLGVLRTAFLALSVLLVWPALREVGGRPTPPPPSAAVPHDPTKDPSTATA